MGEGWHVDRTGGRENWIKGEEQTATSERDSEKKGRVTDR